MLRLLTLVALLQLVVLEDEESSCGWWSVIVPVADASDAGSSSFMFTLVSIRTKWNGPLAVLLYRPSVVEAIYSCWFTCAVCWRTEAGWNNEQTFLSEKMKHKCHGSRSTANENVEDFLILLTSIVII
jgi:hypothetical protein